MLSNQQEFLVLMRLFRKIEKQEPTAMEIRNKCRQNGCIFLMSAKKIILIILQYLFVCGSPEEIMRIIAITVMHHANLAAWNVFHFQNSWYLFGSILTCHMSHQSEQSSLLVPKQKSEHHTLRQSGTSSKGSPRAPLGTCLNTFLLIPVLSFHASLPCSH